LIHSAGDSFVEKGDSMTKAELIEKVAQKTKVSKADAGRVLGGFLESVAQALTKGDSVTLVGFGTFSVGKRAARKGRNPQTGSPLNIPASRVPRFKAGKGLKDAVNK
jgi:DNA-binding protein HU-beta